MRTCLAVVLAAGEGTRMRSRLPKVLHEIGRLPLIAHVLDALKAAQVDRIAAVIGPGHEAVAAAIAARAPAASVHIQAERRGTAHAVLAARDAISAKADDVLVVFGDTPFISSDTVALMRGMLGGGRFGGGRRHGAGRSARLWPPASWTAAGSPQFAKSGTRARRSAPSASATAASWRFRGDVALPILDAIGDDNAQNEFYLTDAVEIANRRGLKVGRRSRSPPTRCSASTTARSSPRPSGISRERRRSAAMAGGATLIAPETVFFAHDTQIGRDVSIEPNVVFGPGVSVADNVTIRAFSHIEGARIASGAIVGPFARLRPGARIGEDAHIGNFVEIKNAERGGGGEDQPPRLCRRRARRREGECRRRHHHLQL